MKWIKLDPITRRRVERFRRIKRGYYSLVIIAVAMVLSVFASFLAESRALVVWYEGRPYFATFSYYDMDTFDQEPPPAWGMGELEAEYLRLQREWSVERYLFRRERAEIGDDQAALATLEAKYPNRRNFVIMPPIPWDPYQSDFWYNEILREIQAALDAGETEVAEVLARRDRLDELGEAIASGEILALLANPERSPTGDLPGLHPFRSDALPRGPRRATADRTRAEATPLPGHRLAGKGRRLAAALRFSHLDLLRSLSRAHWTADRDRSRQPPGVPRGAF